jgi:hypothetical protein
MLEKNIAREMLKKNDARTSVALRRSWFLTRADREDRELVPVMLTLIGVTDRLIHPVNRAT